jgi:hypothetical protein
MMWQLQLQTLYVSYPIPFPGVVTQEEGTKQKQIRTAVPNRGCTALRYDLYYTAVSASPNPSGDASVTR